MLRVVADANTYISAAISPNGNCRRIIDAAQRGEITLVMNEALADEITEVLARDKFRRWLTEDEAADYVDALVLLADWAPDRPAEELPLVCADPDDNYLIALCEDADVDLLVSGDTAVLRITHPNVHIYTPADAVEAIAFRHEWGEGLVPSNKDAIWRHVEAEGNAALINVYSAFHAIFTHADQTEAAELLQFVTVPSTVTRFVAAFEQVRDEICRRGLSTRPWFAAPEVAYLKLPPDPNVTVLITTATPLPADTIHATLVRCPQIPDLSALKFDHWRVFAVGSAVPPERIPPNPAVS
jgi:putative PIN family toxin of toxin-antitoxin system